jgi:hypothetical protein
VQCFFNLERNHFDTSDPRDWGQLSQSVKLYASTNSDSPRCFHQVPPPKKSMKVFLENRRLLMSILVLAQLTMLLALRPANLSCMLMGDRR